MAGSILKELKAHIPFTIFGAITGLIIMFFSLKLPYKFAYNAFYLLHPFHVFLSALVTAGMYRLHTCPVVGINCIRGKCNFWLLIIIGYVGSVGIATISDSLIPYAAESLLGMPNKGMHIGFIEKWWLVNPLAVLGILVAYYKPTTKFPHSLHVLLSTWASLFHIIMAKVELSGVFTYIAIFLFLFLAVWLPCCVSDIVFPLLFIKRSKNKIKGDKMGIDLNDNSFKQEVLEESLPVLVDFWAVWCGPCLRFAPVIEEVAKEYQGRLKICKLNVDEAPNLASIYDIMSIPTLVIFKNGKVLDKIIGAPPKAELIKMIKKYI